MSSTNCCFLTCIQISQEAGQVDWYSHIFKNFTKFAVIHTVKGFGIVKKAEGDVFLELLIFLMIQQMLAIWFLVPLYLSQGLKSFWKMFTYNIVLATSGLRGSMWELSLQHPGFSLRVAHGLQSMRAQ